MPTKSVDLIQDNKTDCFNHCFYSCYNKHLDVDCCNVLKYVFNFVFYLSNFFLNNHIMWHVYKNLSFVYFEWIPMETLIFFFTIFYIYIYIYFFYRFHSLLEYAQRTTQLLNSCKCNVYSPLKQISVKHRIKFVYMTTNMADEEVLKVFFSFSLWFMCV